MQRVPVARGEACNAPLLCINVGPYMLAFADVGTNVREVSTTLSAT